MSLIDQLRAMQLAEIDALNRPAPPTEDVTDMVDWPAGFAGAAMMEEGINAALHAVSDDDLQAAVTIATADNDAWTANHLALEIERRHRDV
jgi:hypothetical protein